MAKVSKYYVVWRGHVPGIYDNWDECKLQTASFPDARFKSFATEKEAYDALIAGPDAFTNSQKKKKKTPLRSDDIIWKSWSVDAACSGNPGVMEYRCVHTELKDEIFRMGPYADGTNNIGEFLALVHALALLQKQSYDDWPIYTDSRTALSWVRKKKVKTTLQKSSQNAVLFQLIDRAVLWLHEHSFRNPIIKWDTKSWGEIPADFGRK